jgi:PAS domain S-box-containing protein
MNNSLDKLVKVIDDVDPNTLTRTDVDEIKTWGADKLALILVDMVSQKILHATEGAEKMFGYMTDEMISLDLIRLVPDEFKDVHPTHVDGFNAAPVERAMGKRDRPLSGRRRDGTEFPVEIGLFPRMWGRRRLCLANLVSLAKTE